MGTDAGGYCQLALSIGEDSAQEVGDHILNLVSEFQRSCITVAPSDAQESQNDNFSILVTENNLPSVSLNDLGKQPRRSIRNPLFRKAAALQKAKRKTVSTHDSKHGEDKEQAREFLGEFNGSVLSAFSDICRETDLTVRIDGVEGDVNLAQPLINYVTRGMSRFVPQTRAVMSYDY